MKLKFLIASLFVGATISVFAQGVQDGIDFYNIGDYENAKTILDRNAASASNPAEVDYYYGMIAFAKGNTVEAKSYFDKGVAANAAYPYNLVGQGAVALKNGNKSDAESLFKKARSLTKKDAKLETAIMRAYYAANPTSYAKDIEKCMNNARKWNMNCPDLDIFEGDRSYAEQNWGDATGHYEMAMNHDPGNVEATVKYADTYYKVNPKYAIAELRKIIDANTNSALAQRQFAEKLYENGDFAEAAERYGKYVKSTNNHFTKDEARYAQLLYFADKFQECYDVASKLKASIEPSNNYYIPSCRLLLYSLDNLKKWDEAAAMGKEMFSYKTESNADTYNFKDCVMYALALDKANQPDEAIKYYNEAIEMQPDNINLVRNLAKQYAAAKKYGPAIEYATKVANAENATTRDYSDLASIYYAVASDTTSSAEAKDDAVTNGVIWADKAIAANPNDITSIYYKAYLQSTKDKKLSDGNALQTMKDMIAAINNQPDTAPYKPTLSYAYQYVTNYYITNKDKANALATAQQWLALDPSNATIAKLVEQLSK